MSDSTASHWEHAADVRRHVELLLNTGEGVVELRALGVAGPRGAGVRAGYFDNADSLIRAAEELDGHAEGVYVTLNPVCGDLLARAANRVVIGPKNATDDKSILRRRFLLVDIDPVRPSGISATDGERQGAFAVAKQVVNFLTARGFPEPVKADSGNGAHIVYAIDLPADDDGLVARCLAALAFQHNTQAATVDQSVCNPARICKLYGTLASKGDSIAERPHRRSRIIALPSPLAIVPLAALEALAALAPAAPTTGPSASRGVSNSGASFDVDAFIRRHGLTVIRSSPWQSGRRWILADCPFNADHNRGEAYIVQQPNGALAAGCQHNSCTWDWRALRTRFEPPQRTTSGTSGTAASGEIQFSAPEELPTELPAVPPFSFDLLPRSLRPWIADLAERIQCPPDFPAVAAMVALAAIVGRKIGIRPKQRDDWLVVPNLWGAVIGRPGIMKTPAIQEALRPLQRLEIAAKESYDAASREYQAAKLVGEQQRELVKQQVKDAIKKQQGDALEIAQKIVSVAAKEPTRKRYIINDSTVEKLGEILHDNPNGILCFRDELTGFLRGLDKDGQEGSRAFFLEAWNGTGSFTFDRIGRGTVEIEAAIVSIVGGIQPGPLSDYLLGAAAQGKRDDGLIQRFQLAVWPDVSREWRNVDAWPDGEAKAAAYAVYERLDALDVVSRAPEWADQKPDSIAFLRFTPDAQLEFDAWRESLERQVRSGDEHPVIESHLAKFRSLIPSIALLIDLAEKDDGPVGLDPLQRAIAWGRFLEAHARRIYSAAIDPAQAAAKALAKHLLKGDLLDGFTSRDLYRRHWSGLADPKLVADALEMLADASWLASTTETTGGRPRTRYRINPALRAPPSKRSAASATSPVPPLSAPAGAETREPSPVDGDAAASANSDETSSGSPTLGTSANGNEVGGAGQSGSDTAAAPPTDPEPPPPESTGIEGYEGEP